MKRFAAMLMVLGATGAWAQDVKPAEKEVAAPPSVPVFVPAGPAGIVKSPIEKAKSAVVRIRSSENKRPVAVGSGVIVSGDGLIVTCSNVVEDAGAAEVQVAGSTEWVGVELVAMREAGGLAVLKVSIDELKKKGVAFGRVKVGEILPAEASEVWSLGFDGEGQYVVKKGIVNSVRPAAKLPERLREAEGFGDSKWLEMDCPVDEHGGGGPVLNAKGELVGVKVWSLDGVPEDNFAVSGVDVAAFLEAKGTFKRAFAGAEGTGRGTQRLIEAARRVRDGWKCTLCDGTGRMEKRSVSKKNAETHVQCRACAGLGVAAGEKVPRLLENVAAALADVDTTGEEGKKAIDFVRTSLSSLRPRKESSISKILNARATKKLAEEPLKIGEVVVFAGMAHHPHRDAAGVQETSATMSGGGTWFYLQTPLIGGELSIQGCIMGGTIVGTRPDSNGRTGYVLKNCFLVRS
jgi:S1-C subfamily serine protease